MTPPVSSARARERAAGQTLHAATTGDGALPLAIAGWIGADDHDPTVFASDDGAQPVLIRADTPLAFFSVTKAFTATAALQLVEEGLLDLDAPAGDILPAIDRLGVLVRVDDGEPVTRPPARRITPRMLLTHTSGLGYDMFDARAAAIARARQRRQRDAPSSTPLRDSLDMPLLHDPGERWTYGISMDWLGLIVQELRGERLEDVLRARVFAPCGMHDTSFDLEASAARRLPPLYRRRADGALAPTPAPAPGRPELDMGGQGLYGTVPDLLRFLRVWLGDGSAPGGRVLEPATVREAVRPVPGIRPGRLASAIPALTRDADMQPGRATGWATAFLATLDDAPGRRRAGSLSWAGLGNVFYWIDRASGIAVVWATQLLPFHDPAVVTAIDAFEDAVYAGVGYDT